MDPGVGDARAARRLFFALWPDPPVQAALADRGRLIRAAAGGRAMRPESLHLTLVFIGDVVADLVPKIEAAAAGVVFEPFDLSIDAVGWFRAKRLAWLGAGETPPRLVTLASGLRERLASHGIGFDPKPFVAHLTVLRNAERVAGPSSVAPVAWPVRDFALVESVAVDGHRDYRVCRRWSGR